MLKYLLKTILFSFLTSSLYAQDNFVPTDTKVNLAIALENPEYCSFFDFEIKSNTLINDDRLIELKKSLGSTFFAEGNILIIHSILQFKDSIGIVFLIGYSELNTDDIYNSQVYVNGDEFEHKDDFIAITNLKSDAFWQFYNDEDNPKYPVINQLKSQVNDRTHIMNINKLASIVRDNKSKLQEYFIENYTKP